MKNIKRLIALLLLIPVIFGVVVFIIDNPDPISIQLIGFSSGPFSIGTWMVLCFALGGVAGLAASSAIIFQLRARVMLATKSAKK